MQYVFYCAQKQDYKKVLARAIFIDFAFQLGIGGGYAILLIGSIGSIGFYIKSLPMGVSRLIFLLFHVIIAIFLCFGWKKYMKNYAYLKKLKIVGVCDYCKCNMHSIINLWINNDHIKTVEIVCSNCNRVLARQTWFIGGGSDG